MFHVALRGPEGESVRLQEALNGRGATGSMTAPFRTLPVEGVGGGVLVGGMADGADAVGVLLSAVRSRRWVGALVIAGRTDTVGAPTDGITEPPRETGPAVARAARRNGRTAVVLGADLEGRAAADPDLAADLRMVEAALDLVAVLEARRSVPQQAAGRLVDAGLSQREAAAELGVSQQAVHSRLRHGFWNETRLVLDGLLPVLARLGRTGQ